MLGLILSRSGHASKSESPLPSISCSPTVCIGAYKDSFSLVPPIIAAFPLHCGHRKRSWSLCKVVERSHLAFDLSAGPEPGTLAGNSPPPLPPLLGHDFDRVSC